MKNKYSKEYLVETARGLQDVDGLKTSDYFNIESERYIKGEITLDELEEIITAYYREKGNSFTREGEADIASAKIIELISDDSFTLSVGQLLSIHKYIFGQVFKHAGQLRTYNITKEEWVLSGETVHYGDYRELEMTLRYDLQTEKEFDYKNLKTEDFIPHIARFIANLWQIHPFGEGNTRTTAVFLIKYLNSRGFNVNNDLFAKNAKYFRNALVRANYSNINKGIEENLTFLIKFLENLLLGKNNLLMNRSLHLSVDKGNKVSKKELRVIRILEEYPSSTALEISEKLNVSLRTVRTLLSTLQKSGAIERIGSNKSGYWKVK